MGIYIKGMEMPKNCHLCPMCLMRFCQAGDRELSERETRPNAKSPEDCPLLPVPPHGRLIDADVAEVISFTDEDKGDFCDGILYAADWISKQPTIIPAEPAKPRELRWREWNYIVPEEGET